MASGLRRSVTIKRAPLHSVSTGGHANRAWEKIWKDNQKALPLDKAIKVLAKSDMLKDAKLCPCAPCRAKVKRMLFQLMGYVYSEDMKACTADVAPELEVAVELALEDLMPIVATAQPRRPLFTLGPPRVVLAKEKK